MKRALVLAAMVMSMSSMAQDVKFDPSDPPAAPAMSSKLLLPDGVEKVVGPGCWLRGDVCIDVANRLDSTEDAVAGVPVVVAVIGGVLLAGLGLSIGYAVGSAKH